MIASALQIAGLVAAIAGLALLAGLGGFVLGAGVSLVYVGLAADRGRP